MSINDIFGNPGSVTWAQECARAALIFVYGLGALRLAGRRLFGQWAALDITVAIVTGSTLSRAMTGNAELWGTLAATTLLITLHWIFARAAVRWTLVSRLLEGSAVQVGEQGNVNHDLLLRYGITPASLEQALRAAGVESIGRAQKVVLEPSGKISVIASKRPNS
jgi:uncharacterized membrane protein YcaP (DUF421 family)